MTTLMEFILTAVKLILSAIVALLYAAAWTQTPESWHVHIVGIHLGLFVFLITLLAFMLLLPYIPFAVQVLANDPNRNRDADEMHRSYPPSTFGFFTTLQPGQVKIIERGQRFVRCIMRYDGHSFRGFDPNSGLPSNTEKYWDVIETRTASSGTKDAHPIQSPGIDAALWEKIFYWWRMKVYDLTGHVFTGIYPFQTVRVYPMDRYELLHDDDGNLTTRMREDFSDHYRVEDFQFPVRVKKADTKDKIPVDVILNFVGRVENPYETAYATDDEWSARLLSIISHAVMTWTRYTPVNNVLSAASKERSLALRNAVLAIDHRKSGEVPKASDGDREEGIEAFGLKAIDNYILDISPVDAETARRLGDLALARVDRDAAKQRAKGEAAGVAEFAAAAKQYGRDGSRALEVQGNINTAKAAGDNAIIILGEGEKKTDPLMAALLREIKSNNAKRNQD